MVAQEGSAAPAEAQAAALHPIRAPTGFDTARLPTLPAKAPATRWPPTAAPAPTVLDAGAAFSPRLQSAIPEDRPDEAACARPRPPAPHVEAAFGPAPAGIALPPLDARSLLGPAAP